jgi:hypothetical protein
VVKVEVRCDRCRAVISADRSKLAVESGPLRNLRTDADGEAVVDLCRECAEAFATWLRQPAEADRRAGRVGG